MVGEPQGGMGLGWTPASLGSADVGVAPWGSFPAAAHAVARAGHRLRDMVDSGDCDDTDVIASGAIP